MMVISTATATVTVILIWIWIRIWIESATEIANRSVGGGLEAMESLRTAEASAKLSGAGCEMAIATVPLLGAAAASRGALWRCLV